MPTDTITFVVGLNVLLYGVVTMGIIIPKKWQNMYSALQKFLNKMKYFLTISKNVLILNALYKQYGSKIRPNESLGLIFDPYCLILSISFC